MASNGLAERKRALNDLFAGIDALCEAENTVLAAEDANNEASATRSATLRAQYKAEEDLLKPEIPLDDALERVRVTAQRYREAKLAMSGEDGTEACLNEAKEARDEAFDEMIKRKDHCQKLRDEQEARREAEAKKERDPRSKSDYAVLNVIKATLKEQGSKPVPIRHADLVTKIKDDLNKLKEEYEADGLDPSDIEQQIHGLANINNVLKSVRNLQRLGDIKVWFGKGDAMYEHGEGPGDVPAPVEEPEPEPGTWVVEDGICRECGRPTDKDKNGRPYPICKSCKFGGNKKPEPDDSGTLFEKPEPSPEPSPVPVPASTVMLEAKPEDVDLAELLRKGKVDVFLASAGHWHSTRFTRGLVLRLKADGASAAALQVFWAILTVLEGLDKDNALIAPETMRALSGLHPSTTSSSRKWLNDFDYITWDKNDNAVGIGPKVSDVIDDDTTDGKEHWHSTRYTLDVVAQLTADGLGVTTRIMFWAILTTLKGLGIKSGKITKRMIAETIGLGTGSLQKHIPRLSESKWITHTPGSTDKGNSRASLATYGFGPRLTNE